MRHDKRYTRVLNIITDPLIPRFEDGGIKLCHLCQRAASFAGSFMRVLTNAAETAAGRYRPPWSKS